jgi:hypothetical protein
MEEDLMRSYVLTALGVLLLSVQAQSGIFDSEIKGCVDCFNFAAPSVGSTASVASPEVGQLIHDMSDDSLKMRGGNNTWRSFLMPTDTGRVGIGTASPSGKFDVDLNDEGVDGSLYTSVNSSVGYVNWNIESPDIYNARSTTNFMHDGIVTSSIFDVADGAGGSRFLIMRTHGEYPMYFQTDNTTRMTITPEGWVGVGRSNPLGLIHAIGGSDPSPDDDKDGLVVENFSPIVMFLDRSSATDDNLRIRGDIGNFYFERNTGTSWDPEPVANQEERLSPETEEDTNLLTILADGKVGMGTDTPTALLSVNGVAEAADWDVTSDSRLKQNIVGIDSYIAGLGAADAEALVELLNPVTFEWIDPRSDAMAGTQLGFIAQDVETVVPDAVRVKPDVDQTRVLKINALIPILVKALQEQKARIDALEAQL